MGFYVSGEADALFQVLFVLLFIFRYTRTIVGIFANIFYKPKPLSSMPKYRPSDATVVVPTTFRNPSELLQCLRSILACSPAAVFVVTCNSNVEVVQKLCDLERLAVHVLGVKKLNKRHQLVCGLRAMEATDIVLLADDDVVWPTRYLDYVLAIFEDERVGAGGTRQRVRRNSKPNFWNFLSISYLERRVWNNLTTNAIDGSISTLSGRTAAYRTNILKTEEFFYYLENDSWLGRPLNTDDDKCLTRYVFSHGWKIALQSDPRSVIMTTLEDNPKYTDQCLRWARSHWRGNGIVMANESYWRSPTYWWGLYVIYIGQFQTPALLFDGTLFALLVLASPPDRLNFACICLASWILLSKVIKLIPYFCRYPQDLIFLPVSIAFSYLHGFINIYALFTLTTTHWGGQQLGMLEKACAKDGELKPLLRGAIAEADEYLETTPGK